MARPRVRLFAVDGHVYYGTDATHLHDSLAQAVDAARREASGWIGPRSGFGQSRGDAPPPLQVWAPDLTSPFRARQL